MAESTGVKLRRSARAAFVVLAGLLGGCTLGPSQEADPAGDSSVRTQGARTDRPPVVRSARIVPAPILLNRPVSVEVEAEEKSEEGDLLSFRYQWLVNGKRLEGGTGPMLDPSLLRRRDRVSVQVVPLAGSLEGAQYQAPDVTVGNTPPSLTSVRLDPSPAHRGVRLRALVEAADPDHDAIRYVYRWWRNQKLERETEEPSLDTADWMRGDVVLVEVIPSDGMSRGKPLASEPIVLANSPPKITSTPATAIEPDRYQYLVAATDPDHDPLSFTIAEGPSGMTIDRMTGLLVWTSPGTAPGPQRVRIVVEDGHEGRAFQEFELKVAVASATP